MNFPDGKYIIAPCIAEENVSRPFSKLFLQNIKSSYPAYSNPQRKYVKLRIAWVRLEYLLWIEARTSWRRHFSLLHSIMSRSMNTIMHYSRILFASFLWLFAYLDGPYNRCITPYNDNNLLMFFTYSKHNKKAIFCHLLSPWFAYKIQCGWYSFSAVSSI